MKVDAQSTPPARTPASHETVNEIDLTCAVAHLAPVSLAQSVGTFPILATCSSDTSSAPLHAAILEDDPSTRSGDGTNISPIGCPLPYTEDANICLQLLSQ